MPPTRNTMLPSAMLLLVMIAGQTKLSLAVDCPSLCKCQWVLDSLSVNCSNLDLVNIPDISHLPIETLDLSYNRFTEFPTELALLQSLTSLDLSNNFISTLPADALLGFKALRQLFLRGNNISQWADINPNRVFLNAVSLETLSLAANPITSFSSNNQLLVLYSPSLTTLDLSFCKIRDIAGSYALQGLAKLQTLMLAGNPLESITKLESPTLQLLNLSNCTFKQLSPNIFIGLPNLYAVDFSRNTELSLLPQGNQYVRSKSLRRINLSFCNMPIISIEGFPNITTLLLKGNMIREITEMNFRWNTQIENLDLSQNTIRSIDPNSFSNLRLLKRLDLSYNMIADIDRNTFSNNEFLTSLNLSRTFLTKFTRITGTSILTLDLSSCEIASIAADSLIHMPITDLDLSSNLISSIPEGFTSQTLQTLDLSLNRLSSITNSTFRHLPELSALKLSGNRFTTPFKTSNFKKNLYLSSIALEDNPWRCDCKDESFKQFFLYLMQTPPKISSVRTLKCTSPEYYFGRTWDGACFMIWFPQKNMSTIEKFWAITVSILAAICLGIFAYKMMLKYKETKKRQRNAAELEANVEEQRRVQTYNRQFIQQEGSQNAPDPRESNPPSYEVALLMPPLKRLTKSYVDITKPESNEAINQPESILRQDHRSRCHSDNALLNGEDNERTAKIRRTPSFRRHAPRSRRGSRLVAVRPPRCPDGTMQTSESLGKMSNFVRFDNSPYTQRKPKSNTTSSISPASSAGDVADAAFSSVPLRNNSLDFIENYYNRPKSISNSGDEYEIVSSHSDLGSVKTSIRSSITSVDLGIVIVHNKPAQASQASSSKESPKSSHDSKEGKELPKESEF